jgi:hypothetical protein
VALVNLLSNGSGALDQMRERARDLGIVLDEHLVRDAERARTELDTLAQVVSANLTRAALEAAPVIADLSSWLADVAGKAGIAWERLFDAPEEKSLRTLRYELDLTESTIAKLQGRIDELRKSPTLGFTTFIDTAQISALQSKIDELSRVRGQTQARIAFLEGPPEQPHAPSQTPPSPDDTAGVKDRAARLQRIQQDLESTLFSITHEGSERIIAEHERRVAEIEALRAKDGSNAEQLDRLIEESASVREAQLSQLQAKEAEAADKVRAANDRVVEGLNAERAALTLGSIVSELCGGAGLEPSDLNVSELDQEVLGYMVPRPVTVREALEKLQQAYLFDVVESDWMLAFRKRERDPVLTIGDESLAAHEPGSQRPPKLFETRTQEAELPRRVTVRYLSRENDYQAAAQQAQLIQDLYETKNELVLELPVVMTDDVAKRAAWAILASAWIVRDSFELYLPPSFLTLDPGDVVDAVKITEALTATFVAGDRLAVIAPASQDASLADISITFKGTRT